MITWPIQQIATVESLNADRPNPQFQALLDQAMLDQAMQIETMNNHREH